MLLGEPTGKVSFSFVGKDCVCVCVCVCLEGWGAPCIIVLAREVWNCVHKLNYFNLRGRERENNGEWLCECVMHLHVKHMCVC